MKYFNILLIVFAMCLLLVAAQNKSAAVICRQPRQTGPCKAIFTRFYYNTAAQKCVPFIYGGCDGNDNNFKIKEACEELCTEKSAAVICGQPKQTGPCKEVITRFYYSTAAQKCVPFIYGGCAGNDNNFKTQEACEKLCTEKSACQQPPNLESPCMAALPRFFYNITTQKCVSFTYGGCGGNDNNFKTQEACDKLCVPKKSVCKQPPKLESPCMATLPRFYYNTATQKCVSFVYGGCGGNDNNFQTQEECEKLCVPKKSACKQAPKLESPCMAALPRFYYNTATQKCVSFVYGGCGGNDNNFQTQEECEKICVPKKSACQQPPKLESPCMAALPRFYYNSATQKCVSFEYGGCGGNDNNFQTEEECEKLCVPKKSAAEICKQPPEQIGPCMAALPRFSYNIATQECVSFIYGGCGGNDNNFQTKEECEKLCTGISGGCGFGGSNDGVIVSFFRQFCQNNG